MAVQGPPDDYTDQLKGAVFNMLSEPHVPLCICHRCIRENDLRAGNGLPLSSVRMIVCPQCGNKRCPKASDHRFACTGSNEPGQPGSIYHASDDRPSEVIIREDRGDW